MRPNGGLREVLGVRRAGLGAAGALAVCWTAGAALGQGGCNVPVTEALPPALFTVTRSTTYLWTDGANRPVTEFSQAFAYATAIGLMDCDVVVSASGPNVNYFWGTWPVHIVASGGNGQVNSDFGPGPVSATGNGPPCVNVEGTSTNFVIDTKCFRGYVAMADASVGPGPWWSNILAQSYIQTSVGPEVVHSSNWIPNPDDDHNSWGWGAGAASASTAVEFSYTSSGEITIDDQVGVSIPGELDRRRIVVPLYSTPGGGSAGGAAIFTPNGHTTGGVATITDLGGGSYQIDQSAVLPFSGAGDTFTTRTVSGNDGAFDADCDGRLTGADFDVVDSWIGTRISEIEEVPGATCPRNEDGTPNQLAARFDFNNNDEIDYDDKYTLDAILTALWTIGQQPNLFGDANGDGVIDCADNCMTATAWGSVVTDATYLAGLDYDLDGDNDGADQEAYGALRVCPADANHDGSVTTQDIFDFLNLWYASDPAADFNGDSAITTQDIFDFLNEWFAATPC